MPVSQAPVSFLLQRLERVMLGHFEALPKALGYDVEVHQGVHLVKAGLGSSMFNIACGRPQVGPHELHEAVLEVIRHYKGQPFAWWIGPLQRDDEVAACLVKAGLRQETTEHAMVHLIQEDVSYDADGPLEIQEILTKAQLSEMCTLLDPYDHTARLFYTQCEDHHIRGAERLFVGRAHGAVCTMGILYQQGTSAGIFSLITAEPHQGKGYGHHMMRFLMKTAKDRGVQEVILSASSEAGFRLYERLGFEKVGLFDCFEYQPSSG